MNIHLIYPQHQPLRKYIKYFLFIRNEDHHYQKSHISFPNTNHCLGLLKDTKIVPTDDQHYCMLPDNRHNSYLTGIYEQPISIQYFGTFEEVCIDFEPLGLEALFGIQLSNMTFLNSVVENLPSGIYSNIYDYAFNTQNAFSAASQLETFFLQLLSRAKDQKFIPFNQYASNRVSDLKTVYNMSLRSVNRLYENAMDISPKVFLNILRMRKSINYLSKGHTQAEAAYLSGFSDQSHFIRQFKKYTNQTPKNFIKACTAIEKEVWIDIL